MKTTTILGGVCIGLATMAGAWLATGAAAQAQQRSDYATEHAGVGDPLLRHLTPAQIRGLGAAAGLGLAKPAELHGLPGPKHVLELADDLELTDEQRDRTQRAYERMRDRAIPAGQRVLDAERRVGEVMQSHPRVIEDEVARALDDAADAWRLLAREHIVAHAEMLSILTPAQVQRYSVLRGYTEAGDN
ncbi:MAG: hypothetical protein ACF8QF_07155 [Phycisphaerales bacterium]